MHKLSKLSYYRQDAAKRQTAGIKFTPFIVRRQYTTMYIARIIGLFQEFTFRNGRPI